MAQFSATMSAFEAEYRAFVLKYIQEQMTPRELELMREVRQLGANADAMENTDLDKTINYCRSIDSLGWLVHKSIFVENYINMAVKSSVTTGTESSAVSVCLCCIDNDLESGMVISTRVPLAAYVELVSNYTLTARECTLCLGEAHTLALTSESVWCSKTSQPKTMEAVSLQDRMLAHEERVKVLQFVSGIDTNGWLAHKHAFIQHQLAQNGPETECMLSSAVHTVLRGVKRDIRAEMGRNIGLPLQQKPRVRVNAATDAVKKI